MIRSSLRYSGKNLGGTEARDLLGSRAKDENVRDVRSKTGSLEGSVLESSRGLQHLNCFLPDD